MQSAHLVLLLYLLAQFDNMIALALEIYGSQNTQEDKDKELKSSTHRLLLLSSANLAMTPRSGDSTASEIFQGLVQ